jgi:4-hydroxy-tetrahydrodipicolinate reductase
LARLMAYQKDYDVKIEEIHHTQKKDAPSGTAITLAEQILAESSVKKTWVNSIAEDATQLSIISKREDPAPGTHIINYASAIDDIEIRHTAHSRQGFAFGAVLAIEFVYGKNGIFTMQDVIRI